MVAGAAARAARPAAARPTRPRRLSRPGAGSWPIPTRRCRRPSAPTSASATDSGSTTGRRFAGGTRAINDQVRFDREWAALRAYAARARRAPDRRRADLRRARQRRPRAPPRALPRRRRGRRAARRLHGQGPALGQPDLRLAARCAAGATAGGSSACAGPSTSSTSRASTTSAASRPTGRCRRARATRSGGRWARGPGPRGRSTPRRRELGPAAADRRGPRRHHPGRSRACASRSACPAWSSCSSASTRDELEQRPPPRALPRRPGPLHGHARQRHAARLVRVAAAGVGRARARRGRARARAVVGPHGAGAVVEAAPVHAPGPGRARAGVRGADEHAGGGGWAVEVAPGRGCS